MIELVTPSSPVTPGGGAPWRPSPAALRQDAAAYHLPEAAALAREASRHLLAMADAVGLTRDQRRRLRCLAGCSELAADGAERWGDELGAKCGGE